MNTDDIKNLIFKTEIDFFFQNASNIRKTMENVNENVRY